ncbi:hypothetical protein EPO34_03925 [Patescibacteria group bacterium]|nr:MAG: hypothetical protein EPO34_03925 [Patescibacteria group bacterium]
MPEQEWVTQVTADESGEWSAQVVSDVPSGMHTITVLGEDGTRSDSLLYVDRETTEGEGRLLSGGLFVSRTDAVVPPAFALSMFVFLTVIVLLAINGVRLGRKTDKAERRTRETARHHHGRNAMVVCVIGVAASFFVGVLVNQSVGVFDRFFPAPVARTVRLSLSGAVIDPITSRPVAGVDVAAGDTAVRTDDAGRFAFSDVDAEQGMRLTHPALARALRVRFPKSIVEADRSRVSAFPVYVPFDAAMYNALIYAVDADARAGRGIWSPGDLGDQELDLVEVTADAAKATVDAIVGNDGNSATYRLRKEGDGWNVVP